MVTGSRLQKAFKAQSIGARDEISLFRAFIRSFGNLGSDALAAEYHGTRHQVEFDEQRGAGRSRPRCELCDVLIVQYEAGNPAGARLTLNQAKVSGKQLGCGYTVRTGTRTTFRANLEQWDLLANRPDVSPATRRFCPPRPLLSGALLPSVGSFGVFYPTGSGSFEFAYFVAELLGPLRNNSGRTGTLMWRHVFLSCRAISGYQEVNGTCCLPMFGDALEKGLIGTPVRDLVRRSKDTKYVRTWLASLLLRLRREHPDSDIPGELLQGLELEGEGEESPAEDALAAPPPVKAAIVVRTRGRGGHNGASNAIGPTR